MSRLRVYENKFHKLNHWTEPVVISTTVSGLGHILDFYFFT